MKTLNLNPTNGGFQYSMPTKVFESMSRTLLNICGVLIALVFSISNVSGQAKTAPTCHEFVINPEFKSQSCQGQTQGVVSNGRGLLSLPSSFDACQNTCAEPWIPIGNSQIHVFSSQFCSSNPMHAYKLPVGTGFNNNITNPISCESNPFQDFPVTTDSRLVGFYNGHQLEGSITYSSSTGAGSTGGTATTGGLPPGRYLLSLQSALGFLSNNSTSIEVKITMTQNSQVGGINSALTTTLGTYTLSPPSSATAPWQYNQIPFELPTNCINQPEAFFQIQISSGTGFILFNSVSIKKVFVGYPLSLCNDTQIPVDSDLVPNFTMPNFFPSPYIIDDPNAPLFNVNNTGTAPIQATFYSTPHSTASQTISYSQNNVTATVGACVIERTFTVAPTISANISITGNCSLPANPTLTASSTQDNSYEWRVSSSSPIATTNSTWNYGTINSPTQTNSYQLRVISNEYYDISDPTNPACESTITGNITFDAPTVSISGNNIFCNGSSTTLTASGSNGTYLWSTGATTPSITVSPTSSTTYSVTLTTQSGCTASTSSAITVLSAPPTVSISGNSNICPGASTTLSAIAGSGTYTYAWSTGVTTPSITVSPSIGTTYSVTVSSPSGCSTSASIIVKPRLSPIVAITSNAPNNTICQASPTLTATSGFSTYSWSASPASGAIPSLSQVTVSPTATTTYTLTVSNSFGCTATANLVMTVNPLPVIAITSNAPNNTICQGSSTTLTTTSGLSTYSWSASPASGTIPSSSVITVSPTATTTYNLTVSNSFGCIATATRIITVNPRPVIAISPSTVTICQGGSATLTATSGFSSYSWTTSGSSTPLPITSNQITVSPTANTGYSVVVSNTYNCSTTATRQVVISKPNPVISPANPIINCGGSVTLSVPAGFTTYSWTLPPTTAILSTLGQVTVSPTATATTYRVSVTNSLGCTATATRTVTVNPTPISFTVSSCYSGSPVTITAQFPVSSPTYTWSNGSTSNSIVVNNTGSWTVTAQNTQGCRTTANVGVSNCFVSNGLAVPGETELDETESFDGSSETASATGTLAVANINTLQIAPNPTDNQFNLSLEFNETQDASVFIQDLTGRILQQRNFGQVKMIQETFTLADLPSGMYLLVVRSEKGLLTTAKIIKE